MPSERHCGSPKRQGTRTEDEMLARQRTCSSSREPYRPWQENAFTAPARIGVVLTALCVACSSGVSSEGSSTPVGGRSTPSGNETRQWRSISDMDPVWAMASTEEHLWVGTSGGLLRYDLEGGSPFRFSGSTGPGEGAVVAVTTDNRGRLWAMSEGGLGRYDSGAWSRPVGAVPHVGVVSAMDVMEDGTIWVGGSRGLTSNGGGGWVRWSLDDAVTDIAKVGDGEGFWIGTAKSGVWHVADDRMISKHVQERGMPCSEVHSLIAGNDEVWTLCDRNGASILARFDGDRWSGYTAPLDQPPVQLGKCRRGVVLLTETVLWQVVQRDFPEAALGEDDVLLAPIFRGERARPQRFRVRPSPAEERSVAHRAAPHRQAPAFALVTAEEPLPENQLPPAFVLRPVTVPLGEEPTRVRCDEKGVWIGTRGLGVTRFARGGRVTHYRTMELVVTDRSFTVAADDEGRAWFLTRDLRAGLLESSTDESFEPALIERDATAGIQILAFGSRGLGAYAIGRVRGANVVRIYQHVRGEWIELFERELRFGPEDETEETGEAGEAGEAGEESDEGSSVDRAPEPLVDFSFFEIDPQGRFWIGVLMPTPNQRRERAPHGVLVVDLEREEVTHHSQEPRGPGAVRLPNDISVVDFTSNGDAWLGGLQGVIVLANDGTVMRFNESNGLTGEVVNDLAIDDDDVPWVATPEGLGHYEQNTWRFFLDNQPENLHVSSLAVDSRGELWAGGNRGAVHYDGTRWEVFTTRDGLISDRISSVHIDRQDRVWFVTDEGISLLTPPEP